MGYFVYIHTNKVNGKRYVGATTMKPEKRWNVGWGYRDCSRFYSVIQECGWDNFDHWYTELDNKDQMEDLEMLLIDYFDTTNPDKGYNLMTGGEHQKHSDESKKKMSVTRKGKYCGVNNHRYGKHHSEETKKKLSEAKRGENNPNYGKHPSEDVIRKRAEACKKPVLQYSKNSEFIREWDSATDVNKELGIDKSHIIACCRGNLKSTGGFVWRYKE